MNVLITFIVSGLWHGVNYILWGIMHGIFVILGDKYKTKYKILNRVVTFIIVSFLWSFFIWSDAGTAVSMIISVFTNFNIADVWQNFIFLGLTLTEWGVLSAFTAALFIFDGNKTKIISKIKSMSPEMKTIFICTVVLLVLVFGVYGVGFNVDEFIYSKF